MDDLKYEFYINASPERVWQALTSPEEVKNIFYGSVLQSTFEIGSPLAYVSLGKAGDEIVHIYGTLLEFEVNKVFSYSCHMGEAYFPDHAKYESRVTYQLEATGKCTKLTVIQDQWANDDPTYENNAKGWWVLLSFLKTWIETGKPLDMGESGRHTGEGE